MITARLRFVSIVAISILALSFVLAACSSPGSGVDGILPVGTDVVVRVDITRGKTGQIRKVFRLLERVPAFAIAEEKIPSAEKFVEDSTQDIKGPKITWKKDIKPWLGKEAGAGVWRSGKGISKESIGWAGWIDSTDEGATTKMLTDSKDLKKVKAYKGVDIFKNKDEDTMFAAVFGGKLVVSSTVKNLHTAIRANQGKSLEDSDDFGKLDDEIHVDGRTPIASVMLTPHLWVDAKAGLEFLKAKTKRGESLDPIGSAMDDVVASMDDKSTTKESDKGQSAQAQKMMGLAGGAITKLQKKHAGFTMSAGAKGSAIWLDGGFSYRSDAAVKSGDALKRAKGLPQNTLGAVLSDREHGALYKEMMKAYSGSLSDPANMAMMEASPTTSNPGAQQAMKAYVEFLGDASNLKTLQKIFGNSSRGAVGLIESEGQLAIGGRLSVEDTAAARTMGTKLMALVSGSAAAIPGLKVSMAPYKSNSVTGKSPHDVITVSGIPVKLLTKDAPAATMKALATSPLAKEWLQPELQFDVHLTKDELIIGIPAWGAESVEEAADGSLAQDSTFKRDLKAAGVPKNVSSLAWLNTEEVVDVVVSQVDQKIAGFLAGQLKHGGNVVAWSTTKKSDGRVVTRFSMAFPFYS